MMLSVALVVQIVPLCGSVLPSLCYSASPRQAVHDIHECISALILCLKSVVSDNSSAIATSAEPAKEDFCPRIQFTSKCKSEP